MRGKSECCGELFFFSCSWGGLLPVWAIGMRKICDVANVFSATMDANKRRRQLEVCLLAFLLCLCWSAILPHLMFCVRVCCFCFMIVGMLAGCSLLWRSWTFRYTSPLLFSFFSFPFHGFAARIYLFDLAILFYFFLFRFCCVAGL